MTDEIAQCYRLLELEQGASPEAVKQAYRELVKIWHPDRFPNDPKFQKRANEKTKEINEAYKKIISYQSGNGSESRLPPFVDGNGAEPERKPTLQSEHEKQRKVK